MLHISPFLCVYCNKYKHTQHKGCYRMLDILRARRSIRKFQDRAIEPEVIELLKEALLRSPSSRGINPWEFIFIDDPLILKKLAKSKEHGSELLDGAALGIVVCGDETRSDVWVEDCSIASVIVQLTAQTIGLGSCWVQIRNRNHDTAITSERYVQELLDIPHHIRVESIIALGNPNEIKNPVPYEKLQFHKLHHNRFP